MLTEKEKKILGMMTDEGRLRSGIREEVAASDAYAREIIADYIPEALTRRLSLKENLEIELSCLEVEIAVLNEMSGQGDNNE